jgi:hypothetical protein
MIKKNFLLKKTLAMIECFFNVKNNRSKPQHNAGQRSRTPPKLKCMA